MCKACKEVYFHPDSFESKYANVKNHGDARLFNLPEYYVRRIFIVEGEYDTMVLAQQGYNAVSSTAGAGTFLEEWAVHFLRIPLVYVCYDSDEAGKQGASAIQALIPKARLIMLNGSKDATEYFKTHTKDDFESLIQQADREPQNQGEVRLGGLYSHG